MDTKHPTSEQTRRERFIRETGEYLSANLHEPSADWPRKVAQQSTAPLRIVARGQDDHSATANGDGTQEHFPISQHANVNFVWSLGEVEVSVVAGRSRVELVITKKPRFRAAG